MIDASKYPNLSIHANEAWSQAWQDKHKDTVGVRMIASRQMPNDEALYVWSSAGGLFELEHSRGPIDQEDYSFDTLEEALQIANDIKGTKEEWDALYDRSNTVILEKFLKENCPTLCLNDHRSITASKLLPFGSSVDVWVNDEDEAMLGEYVFNNETDAYARLYRFPDLRSALLAADKIDGTEQSWEAISEFKV